jgi:carboxylesterase type B
MSTIITTSNLGQIRGKSGDGVTQYLGIKYATLKDRFADAQLVEERHGDILDATADGYIMMLPRCYESRNTDTTADPQHWRFLSDVTSS